MPFDGLEGVVLHLHLLSCVIQSDQNAYRARGLNRSLERLTLVITDRRKSDLIHDLNTIAFAGKLIPFVINRAICKGDGHGVGSIWAEIAMLKTNRIPRFFRYSRSSPDFDGFFSRSCQSDSSR